MQARKVTDENELRYIQEQRMLRTAGINTAMRIPRYRRLDSKCTILSGITQSNQPAVRIIVRSFQQFCVSVVNALFGGMK